MEWNANLTHAPEDMCALRVWHIEAEGTVELNIFLKHQSAVDLIHDDMYLVPVGKDVCCNCVMNH